jgi:hypothetical protein
MDYYLFDLGLGLEWSLLFSYVWYFFLVLQILSKNSHTKPIVFVVQFLIPLVVMTVAIHI